MWALQGQTAAYIRWLCITSSSLRSSDQVCRLFLHPGLKRNRMTSVDTSQHVLLLFCIQCMYSLYSYHTSSYLSVHNVSLMPLCIYIYRNTLLCTLLLFAIHRCSSASECFGEVGHTSTLSQPPTTTETGRGWNVNLKSACHTKVVE